MARRVRGPHALSSRTPRACATSRCCSTTPASSSTPSTSSARPRAPRRAPRARTSAAGDADVEARRAGDGDAGALLDPQAKREYRTRLEDLRAEIEEAESFNDPERAARAREEMEFIARELSSAVGLGGRDRKAASNAERARVNVTRAVKGVIRRIAAEDESLGRELETTVHTGYFCRYEPDPRHPVAWQVDGG